MLTLNGDVVRKAKLIPYTRFKISLVIAISYARKYPVLRNKLPKDW